MNRVFDYQCISCGQVDELVVVDKIPAFIDCPCGSRMQRVWLRGPAVHGDIAPYFDVQLGRYVGSRQERDRLLKERGRVAMGPDEQRWTASQEHAPDTPKLDQDKLHDAMEKAYADIQSGNIPMEEAQPLPEYVQPTKGLVA